MSDSTGFQADFLKKVWRRLRDSSVPIVEHEGYKQADETAKRLGDAIDNHLFLPSTIHGYLGIQKGGGVTRFLPILTAEDLGVYYHLCYRLAPKILTKQSGVFGAWHMKPEVDEQLEEDAKGFGQGYGANPFSSYWWLKEWRQFNSLIQAVIDDKSVGNYVVSTDVANFYDSIEVPRLMGKVRRIAHDDVNTVEALNAFLSYWNRRHVGYMASTKGIPQEIISDASRILSHFYLQDFDKAFGVYCEENNLKYIRWADDFLIFGGSKKRLQSAVHYAARLLRDLGLNLNAAKTKYMSKSALRKYRCLNFVAAVSTDNHNSVSKELKKIKSNLANAADFRIDTVFRSMIGYLHRNPEARTATNIAFLVDVGESHIDLLHSLNNTQMLRYIQLMDDPMKAMDSLRKQICRADFGAPKASYLHMMRKYRSQLAAIGMTQKKALRAIEEIEEIEDSSADSEVITVFCVPRVRQQYT